MKIRNIVMTSAGLLMIGAVVAHTLEPSLIADALSPPEQVETVNPPEVPVAVPITVSFPGYVSSESADLSVRFDHSVLLNGDNDGVAMIEIKAADTALTERTAVAMTVVIDVSGSMAGLKIDNARTAAAQLVERLQNGDTLTVIAFNRSARVAVDNMLMTSDRSQALNAIRSLQATGGTCIRCGLQEAQSSYQRAGNGMEYQRRVIVLSDGQGSASAAELAADAENLVELSQAPVVAIGLGRNTDVTRMNAIAEAGLAPYYFIHNSTVMSQILDRELAALEQTALANVTLEIVPAPGVVFGQTDAVGTTFVDGRLYVNIGQMPAGSSRRILVPLTVPAGQLGASPCGADPSISGCGSPTPFPYAPGSVLTVRASFTPAAAEASILTAYGTLTRTDDPAVVAASQDNEVMALFAQMDNARRIDDAISAIQQGDRGRGLEMLRAAQTEISANAVSFDSADLAEEAEQTQLMLDGLVNAEPDSPAEIGTLELNIARTQNVRRGEVGGSSAGYFDNGAFDMEATE